jgi:hypothetical protein
MVFGANCLNAKMYVTGGICLKVALITHNHPTLILLFTGICKHLLNQTCQISMLVNVCVVTQHVPLVEQELLTLPKHLSSPLVFSGVCVTQSLVFCVIFCLPFFVFIFICSAIVLSVLQIMASDYSFGIFKIWNTMYI